MGAPLPRVLDFSVISEPCNYEVKFFSYRQIATGSGRAPLPDYMRFDALEKTVTIFSPNEDDAATNFFIVINASLNDIEKTQISTSFLVTVPPLAEEAVPVIEQDDPSRIFIGMPEWLSSLEDQYVAVGSAFLYEIGPPVDTLGREMDLEVILG